MNAAAVEPEASAAEMTDVSERSLVSACGHLLSLSLRRLLFSKQTLVCLALTTLLILIVVAWSIPPRRTARKLAEQVLVTTFVGFLMPIFAISYGASCVGGEREDQTLIYLLISPIPRPLIYATKAAAALIQVWVWTTVSLTGLCMCAMIGGLSTDATLRVLTVFLPACLFGVSAYTALFLLLGTAFRFGTVISLAYWFFLEVLFGAMPGLVKRITVSFYVKSWIYDAGEELSLGPLGRVARETFLGVSGETASLVLATASILLLASGAALFGRREFSELG